jgi:flagellar basal body P-ring formation protein FlgA
MRFFLSTIIMLLVLVAPAVALEISFKESAGVAESVVRLGDVAEVDQQSPFARDLGQQVVAQAPPLGNALVINADDLARQLRAKVGGAAELNFSGAASIKVTRGERIIDNERILLMISDFFAANRHKLPPAEISFTPIAPALPFAIPEGELQVAIIPSNPNILGSSSFSLILTVGGKVVKNMSVRGRLKALAQIVVTSAPLRKGTVLQAQHLGQAAIDINDLIEPEYDAEKLLGLQLTRSLPTGSPILGHMVEEQPVVRRGQVVRMVIASGSLHLSATGLAHSDGKIDQMIRVQNLSSSKTIHGRVTGPGVVEVLL